jgi:hypothetical protein
LGGPSRLTFCTFTRTHTHQSRTFKTNHPLPPTTHNTTQCPNLRSLELPYKSHVSPRLLSSLVSTAAAGGCLTSLSLAYCADVRTVVMVRMGRGFTVLAVLAVLLCCCAAASLVSIAATDGPAWRWPVGMDGVCRLRCFLTIYSCVRACVRVCARASHYHHHTTNTNTPQNQHQNYSSPTTRSPLCGASKTCGTLISGAWTD